MSKPSNPVVKHHQASHLRFQFALAVRNGAPSAQIQAREQHSLPPLGGDGYRRGKEHVSGCPVNKEAVVRVRLAPTELKMEFRMGFKVWSAFHPELPSCHNLNASTVVVSFSFVYRYIET